MQVEFRSHFSGKNCVLWARKYGKFGKLVRLLVLLKRKIISLFISISCLINFNFILIQLVTWYCEDERDITCTICYHSSLSCIVWPSTLTEHQMDCVVLELPVYCPAWAVYLVHV